METVQPGGVDSWLVVKDFLKNNEDRIRGTKHKKTNRIVMSKTTSFTFFYSWTSKVNKKWNEDKVRNEIKRIPGK